MKTPRNLSGSDLLKILSKHGYQIVRQVGSHVRLTRKTDKGDQHITIPMHDPIKIGTLNDILNDVSFHLNLTKEEILNR